MYLVCGNVEQEHGTYRITVGDEVLSLALLSFLALRHTRSSKRSDDLSERGERLVDVCTFFESLPSGTSRIGSLGTGKIDEIDARHFLRVQVSVYIVPLHRQ